MREEQRTHLQGIIRKLETLDEKSLISYWIKAEIDEADMYRKLAEKAKEYSWDQRIPALFLKLAEDSLKHAEILLREYKNRYHGEKLVEVDVPSIEVEITEEDLENYLRRGRLKDLLEILMEGEKLAMEIYQYLAGRSEGELAKAFRSLARIEEKHYQKLRELRKLSEKQV